MVRRISIFFSILMVFVIGLSARASAQVKGVTLKGTVTEHESGLPVIGAVVKIGGDYLWTTTDIDGAFRFDNVQRGEWYLEVSCLGYVTVTKELDVRNDVNDLRIALYENSLALDEVVVTAQKLKDGLSTSHSLGRDALNHLQLSNTTDIAALLPGGKTVNPDLTSGNSFSIIVLNSLNVMIFVF